MKKPYKLTEDRINREGFDYNRHSVRVPHGTSMDDILDHAFWQHASAKADGRGLRVNDFITVITDDQSFRAHLVVMAVQPRIGARVLVLDHWDFTKTAAEPLPKGDENYEIKWRGGAKWSVVRKNDGTVIRDKMESEEEAHRELASYMKALAA